MGNKEGSQRELIVTLSRLFQHLLIGHQYVEPFRDPFSAQFRRKNYKVN